MASQASSRRPPAFSKQFPLCVFCVLTSLGTGCAPHSIDRETPKMSTDQTSQTIRASHPGQAIQAGHAPVNGLSMYYGIRPAETSWRDSPARVGG
jgi:hypothetical protein